MVIRWPKRITDKGGVRSQFTHCTDVAPTILEAAGLPEPKQVNGVEQMPMQGVSFAFTFDDAKAPSRHTQQYFEISGNRAMYRTAGWRAGDWTESHGRSIPKHSRDSHLVKWNPDNDKCELLQDLDEDFSQADNVADKYPDKVPRADRALLVGGRKNTRCCRYSGRWHRYGGFPKVYPTRRNSFTKTERRTFLPV